MIDAKEFARMWKDGSLSRVEIAAHFGIPRTTTRRVAMRFGLSAKRGYKPSLRRNRDPSSKEIARLCEEIQAGWHKSRLDRQGHARPRYYD